MTVDSNNKKGAFYFPWTEDRLEKLLSVVKAQKAHIKTSDVPMEAKWMTVMKKLKSDYGDTFLKLNCKWSSVSSKT